MFVLIRFPNIKFLRHENFIPPDLEYGSKGANIEDEYGQLRSGDQIAVRAHAEWIAATENLDVWYAAKSKNPSDPTITKGMPDRNITVEDPNELVKEHNGVTVCHPFLYTEKDWIVKQYIDNDVSCDYVLCIKLFVEEILRRITVASIDTLDEINRIREIQRLPKLRRIDSTIFIKLVENLFNDDSVFNCGETGQSNKDTVLSEAVEVV